MARPKKPDAEKVHYQWVAIARSDYVSLTEKMGHDIRKPTKIEVFHEMINEYVPIKKIVTKK